MTKLASTALTSLYFTAAANAGLITGITVESSSAADLPAVDAVNGSGLPSDVPALSGTHDNTFEDHFLGIGSTVANEDVELIIDLGTTTTIGSISVWNFNEGGTDINTGQLLTGRGAKNVTISSSLDNASYTLVGTFEFAQATGLADYAGFQIPVSVASARYIKFEMADNHGNDFGIGLAEVQFDSVPEPGTLALLGLGGLMIARRRIA